MRRARISSASARSSSREKALRSAVDSRRASRLMGGREMRASVRRRGRDAGSLGHRRVRNLPSNGGGGRTDPAIGRTPRAGSRSGAARDRESGDVRELGRQQPDVREGAARVVDEGARPLHRAVDAQQRGVGALPQLDVAARRLPQLVGRRGDVEDVVGDLEREADGRAVASRARRCRASEAPAASPPSPAAAMISAPVLARWIRSSCSSVSDSPSPSRSSCWPPIMPPAPDALHQLPHDRAAGRVGQVERARRIERRSARRAAPSRGRPSVAAGTPNTRCTVGRPAAHVVVVHARQVVVHERVGVHDLDGRRERRGVARPAGRLVRGEHQDRRAAACPRPAASSGSPPRRPARARRGSARRTPRSATSTRTRCSAKRCTVGSDAGCVGNEPCGARPRSSWPQTSSAGSANVPSLCSTSSFTCASRARQLDRRVAQLRHALLEQRERAVERQLVVLERVHDLLQADEGRFEGHRRGHVGVMGNRRRHGASAAALARPRARCRRAPAGRTHVPPGSRRSATAGARPRRARRRSRVPRSREGSARATARRPPRRARGAAP